MSFSNPVAAAAPQTPPSSRIHLGSAFTFASLASKTTTSALSALSDLSASSSGVIEGLGSPVFSSATTFIDSQSLLSPTASASAGLNSPALSAVSSGSLTGFTPVVRRLSLGAAASGQALPSLSTLFPHIPKETGTSAPATAAMATHVSAASLLGLGSPRRGEADSLQQRKHSRTEEVLNYATAPFIQNAKTNETLFKYQDFSVEVADQKVLIDALSYKKIGSGHFSNVYACTSKADFSQKYVLRFFKDDPGTGPVGLMSPVKKNPNVSAKRTLRYLANQFIRYAKIQSNEFLSQHHVKFHTFDRLIEKARNNPALLAEIQELLSENSFNEQNRIKFAMDNLTDGYILAECAQMPCTSLDYTITNQIRTLYDSLDVTLDPHLANWSTDGRMCDIYEEEHDAEHTADRLLKAVGKENYNQFFAKPAVLTDELTKKTPWGELLYPDEAGVEEEAVGAAAAAGPMGQMAAYASAGPGSSAAAVEDLD